MRDKSEFLSLSRRRRRRRLFPLPPLPPLPPPLPPPTPPPEKEAASSCAGKKTRFRLEKVKSQTHNGFSRRESERSERTGGKMAAAAAAKKRESREEKQKQKKGETKDVCFSRFCFPFETRKKERKKERKKKK